MFNRVNNIFKNVILKRILVIFIVGLVSRSLVNFMLYVNIFTLTDCGNDKLFIYWGMITGFLTIVSELPGINFNVFNLKLIRNSISLYIENIFKSGDKLTCGSESFNKDFKTSSPDDQLVYTQNNSRGHSRKTSGSSSGGRVHSAGVAGLYGENSRTRKVSAGVRGLYGDDSTRYSSSSNKEFISNRDNRRVGNIVVIRDHNDLCNERVSGFKTSNRNISGNIIQRDKRQIFVSESGIKYFVGSNGNKYIIPSDAGSEYEVNTEGSEYTSSKRSASFTESNKYSSYNSGARERIAPTAPRPTNYSTPETMSPLITPSNNSERFYGRSNEAVERGWGSFFSNSLIVKASSPSLNDSPNLNDSPSFYDGYNSDFERGKIYHKKCRDISEGISKDFSKRRR